MSTNSRSELVANANQRSYSDYDYDVEVEDVGYRLRHAWTEYDQRGVNSSDVTQGRILWLPAKEDLPERAVKRAHGKGAIEEGIYDHPVVIISRPSEDSKVAHFHLITSLQGKRLDQLYGKANEFHASRRSWYLPIAPTPDHPDAVSKKTKKRFPTLELADDATLRWDSYVNIRHVYKTEWQHLKAYTNPENPYTDEYRFKPDSMIRMLSKGKTLTMYEPSPQHVDLPLRRSASDPIHVSTHWDQVTSVSDHDRRTIGLGSILYTHMTQPTPTAYDVDFQLPSTNDDRIAGPPPKVPPDSEREPLIVSIVHEILVQPLGQFAGNMRSLAVDTVVRPPAIVFDPSVIRKPLDRVWRDFKGFTAVVVASTM